MTVTSPVSGPATGAGSSSTPIRDLRIVVPARDEAETLAECLAALTVAMDSIRCASAGVRVQLVLVLDSCRDASARIAARASERDERIRVIEGLHGSVGEARRAGVRAALSLSSGGDPTAVDPTSTWIASTDADSAVPRGWLLTQLEFADAGIDLLLGTVNVEPQSDAPHIEAGWRRDYSSVEGHPHIHGANLGVRASAYLAAGGFPPIREHEDTGLAAAVSACGFTVHSTASSPVLTSGRQRGRTPGGFAGYLEDLCAPNLEPRDNRDTASERSRA
ncbi:glycosyltransferase [Pseudoclavibacter sp. VKM Ac-2888]|uniref:glycosyltransferase n=1 Tax=Pseudoclavibacter sp. VKM Ac-2888 TaxID=2783830 RepID=UPI00188CCAC6|nr:glycosyltransferase [Pseudoclavibacter sp. VKM Ac-2888]MBF4549270.1 glycosyltransferase [Pseudoclavibacter sp. VKM Ac-2888]